jgi:hypothetical protein
MFAFATIVGIPLALMLGALYLALIYLAHVVVALWIGHALLRGRAADVRARAVGAGRRLFVLYAGAAIPGFAASSRFVVRLASARWCSPSCSALPPRRPARPLAEETRVPENPNQGTPP